MKMRSKAWALGGPGSSRNRCRPYKAELAWADVTLRHTQANQADVSSALSHAWAPNQHGRSRLTVRHRTGLVSMGRTWTDAAFYSGPLALANEEQQFADMMFSLENDGDTAS